MASRVALKRQRMISALASLSTGGSKNLWVMISFYNLDKTTTPHVTEKGTHHQRRNEGQSAHLISPTRELILKRAVLAGTFVFSPAMSSRGENKVVSDEFACSLACAYSTSQYP